MTGRTISHYRIGSKVSYRLQEGQKPSLYLIDFGSNSHARGERKICEQCGVSSDLSPDGKRVLA